MHDTQITHKVTGLPPIIQAAALPSPASQVVALPPPASQAAATDRQQSLRLCTYSNRELKLFLTIRQQQQARYKVTNRNYNKSVTLNPSTPPDQSESSIA